MLSACGPKIHLALLFLLAALAESHFLLLWPPPPSPFSRACTLYITRPPPRIAVIRVCMPLYLNLLSPRLSCSLGALHFLALSLPIVE